jgi:hypothetical protein
MTMCPITVFFGASAGQHCLPIHVQHVHHQEGERSALPGDNLPVKQEVPCGCHLWRTADGEDLEGAR